MDYTVTLQDVLARTTAVARGRARSKDIGEKIVELLSPVWDFIHASGIEHYGQNVVVYFDREDGALLLTEEGVPIEAGVLVKSPFSDSAAVVCSATPAGPVASTLHIGPYHKLHEAHKAVREWCHNNAHPIAGPNWEIYGHWTDDLEKLETEVIYLLKPAAAPAA